jgi:DNA-binding FadR family transcriptional regulator
VSAASDSEPPRQPPQKFAEAVAGKIGQDIAHRGWPVGERLGSEPELMERYGVSRAVLREAVRILEREDVALTRRGPNGGVFVKAPNSSTAVKSMSHYLDFAGVSPLDLYEARRALELRCVELAVSRLDEPGIERLRAHLEQEHEVCETDITDLSHQFHRLLAELTGNHALLLFVQCSTELAARFSRRSPRSVHRPALGREIHGAHQRIADAIVSGDAALARHHMGRHLDAIIAAVKSSTDGRARGTLTPPDESVADPC